MNLKEKILSGRPVFGMFVKSCSPALVEIQGHAGFDYVLLDMEHSPVSIENLEHMIRAAETVGLAPVVRVPALTESAILQPLDKGAAGLLVPMVNTPDMARQVVRHAKYAPQGSRGMDIYARSARFGAVPKEEYFAQANRNTLLAVQIEGLEGVRNAVPIAAVEEIDVVYVGPYDLSQALGIPGQVNDPAVYDHVRRIVEAVAAEGKSAGIYVDDIETALRYREAGIRFITLCVDTTLFFRACRGLIEELNRGPAGGAP